MHIGAALQPLVGLVLRCGLQAIMTAAHASLTVPAWRHAVCMQSQKRKRVRHDRAISSPGSWRKAGRARWLLIVPRLSGAGRCKAQLLQGPSAQSILLTGGPILWDLHRTSEGLSLAHPSLQTGLCSRRQAAQASICHQVCS